MCCTAPESGERPVACPRGTADPLGRRRADRCADERPPHQWPSAGRTRHVSDREQSLAAGRRRRGEPRPMPHQPASRTGIAALTPVPWSCTPMISTPSVFDLDGVVTDTARVHSAAWACDLRRATREPREAAHVRSPVHADDYRSYVDGRPSRWHRASSHRVASRSRRRTGRRPGGGPVRGLGAARCAFSWSACMGPGSPALRSTVGLIRRLRAAGCASPWSRPAAMRRGPGRGEDRAVSSRSGGRPRPRRR